MKLHENDRIIFRDDLCANGVCGLFTMYSGMIDFIHSQTVHRVRIVAGNAFQAKGEGFWFPCEAIKYVIKDDNKLVRWGD